MYGILSVQLAFTTIACLLPMYSDAARKFWLSPSGVALAWLAILSSIVATCALFCCALDRKVPTNYILLSVFTVCEAYVVAFICATVPDRQVVVTAALLTTAIVVGITVYSLLSSTDFTSCGAFLFMIGFALMGFGFVCAIFGFRLPLLYCVCVVIFFGLYLIFDT